MSTIAFAVVASALLTVLCLGSRRSAPRLPAVERLWFHSAVTWPVLFKTSVGVLIPSAALLSPETQLLFAYAPGVVLGGVVLLKRIAIRPTRLSMPGVLLTMVASLGLPYAFLAEGTPVAVVTVVAYLPFCVRSAPVSAAAWGRSAHGALAFVLSAFAVAVLLAPEVAIEACRPDKCSVLGAALTSPLTGNGNYIGVAIVILLAAASAGARPGTAGILAVAGLAVVEASGSRAALLAVAVVATALVIGAFSGQMANRLLRWLILPVGVIGTVVAAVVAFPPEFATTRGSLWIVARQLVAENPIWGHGPSHWVRQTVTTALNANYGAHNLWLETAVAGGIVAVGLVSVAGILMVRQSTGSSAFLLLMVVSAVVYLGILESPLQIGRLGMIPFAGLLPVAIASSLAHRRGPNESEGPGLVPAERERLARPATPSRA